MRKTIRSLLLVVFILLLMTGMQVKAQNEGLDGYFNSGGTFLNSSQGLIGCIGEPVIGLIHQDWQHSLQGFAYKTLSPKITTPSNDLLNIKVHVHIYPNPVNKYINIKYVGLITGEEKYLINDETGRVVLSGLLTEPITQIKADNLRPGMYVFLLINNNTGKNIYSSKFVKIK